MPRPAALRAQPRARAGAGPAPRALAALALLVGPPLAAGHSITRGPILNRLRQRIRDVRPAPDGYLYMLTDQNPGVVLRLEPVAEQR